VLIVIISMCINHAASPRMGNTSKPRSRRAVREIAPLPPIAGRLAGRTFDALRRIEVISDPQPDQKLVKRGFLDHLPLGVHGPKASLAVLRSLIAVICGLGPVHRQPSPVHDREGGLTVRQGQAHPTGLRLVGRSRQYVNDVWRANLGDSLKRGLSDVAIVIGE
jgi:hypothetical protein